MGTRTFMGRPGKNPTSQARKWRSFSHKTFCRLFVIVVFACLCGNAMAQRPPGPVTLQWPSHSFPSLQAAVNALPDGGVLEITEGEFRIPEPVVLTGKRVVIQGAGSGIQIKEDGQERKMKPREKMRRNPPRPTPPKIKRKGPMTHLVGPPPRPVVDRSGNMLVPVDTVVGMFNVRSADVVIRDISLSGFDAAIVFEDAPIDRLEPAGSLTVINSDIHDTGRGVVSRSAAGNTMISDSSIRNTKWNGAVSVSHHTPGVTIDPRFFIEKTFFIDLANAGVYCVDSPWLIVSNSVVYGGKGGGIVALNCDYVDIAHSIVQYGNIYGILVAQAQSAVIFEDQVWNIYPDGHTGWFGDGIVVVLSDVTVLNTHVAYVARAVFSNFGGYAKLADTLLQCGSFAMEGESYLGTDFEYFDGGGVYCGCPVADSPCVSVSAGLPPPDPVESLP